jgi:hypothetical protein
MGVALGLIAIAMVGAAGEPKPGGETVPIQYTVCFMETEGMGWREAVYTRLTPVTRQGAATVWTAPGNVKARLLQQAIKERGTRSAQPTAFKAWSGSPVHFQVRSDRYLVTQVAWDGNDRPEGGKPESVRTGPVGTMSGRKLDQGVLVRLVLEDTEVRAVHHVKLPRAGEHLGQAAKGDTGAQPQVFIGEGKAAGLTAIACALPPFLAIPISGQACAQGTIAEIRFDGTATLNAEETKAKLLSRVDQPLDLEKIKADLKTLTLTRMFSDVSASYAPFLDGKQILYFTVHEKHVNGAGETPKKDPGTAKSTASSDCACEKVGEIRAHFETTSPVAPCCESPVNTATAPVADDVKTVSIDVPEIATQEIAGEWLIPKDGMLLVSFGPHTVAGKDGMAVVRERLAILEAAPEENGPVRRTTAASSRVPAPDPDAAAIPRPIPAPVGTGIAPGSFPTLPSRSIPQGVHADGTPAELPPLPAEDPEDAPSSDSAEPRPSPQTKKVLPSPSKPVPVPDSQMKRTGHTATSMLSTLPSVFLAANPTVGLQFLMPVKAVSLKLPFNRKLEIEVFGRVVRNPEPVEPPAELVVRPKTSESR